MDPTRTIGGFEGEGWCTRRNAREMVIARWSVPSDQAPGFAAAFSEITCL